jgi:hypothetical protein
MRRSNRSRIWRDGRWSGLARDDGFAPKNRTQSSVRDKGRARRLSSGHRCATRRAGLHDAGPGALGDAPLGSLSRGRGAGHRGLDAMPSPARQLRRASSYRGLGRLVLLLERRRSIITGLSPKLPEDRSEGFRLDGPPTLAVTCSSLRALGAGTRNEDRSNVCMENPRVQSTIHC